VRRPSLPLTLLLATVPLATLSACGSDDGESPATTAATTTTQAAADCRAVAMPDPKSDLRLRRPTSRLAPTVPWRAIVETSCGSFTITLDVADSPKTAASFASLAREGFYDDLTFHRIAPGFVIQGGDPLGNGLGGPGYTVVEPPPRTARYVHGTVAMAKTATDPDGTSGSQFFVVTGEDAQLPPQYAVLGEVTEGLETIDLIESQPLADDDPQGAPPADPIVIERVEIRQG
jgi:cyclophilin family peptidyl-prolyl cis-trans isomerase